MLTAKLAVTKEVHVAREPTEHQTHEYLDEHLPYILKMVRYNIAQICRPWQFYLSYNAHFESFAVNARNLTNFLTNGDRGNMKAHHIAKDFRVRPGNIATLMKKLDQQVFHLSMNRTRAIGKFDTENAEAVAKWIEENFELFLAALAPLRNKFNDKKAVPEVEADVFDNHRPSASSADPQTAGTIIGPNYPAGHRNINFTGSAQPRGPSQPYDPPQPHDPPQPRKP
jgi:hypothetical protein